MFIDAATAARIDRVEARLSCAIADTLVRAGAAPPPHVTRLDGGAAVLARRGSPMNKLIGAGFDGTLDVRALADIEAAWHGRGEPVRVELASLAAPGVAEQLSERGYRLLGCEHVLVRPVDPADVDRAPAHPVLRDDPRWRDTLITGFIASDGTGASVDDYTRDVIEAAMNDFADTPGFDRYVAALADTAAGAATLRIDDRVALLCGAATVPAARRRGVQAALLAARLRDAARAGCDLAVLTTAPGSLSERNATRQGFSLAYVRTILVLPPLSP